MHSMYFLFDVIIRVFKSEQSYKRKGLHFIKANNRVIRMEKKLYPSLVTSSHSIHVPTQLPFQLLDKKNASDILC